jgi:hypothetical protein
VTVPVALHVTTLFEAEGPTAGTVVTIARPQLAWAGRWDIHRTHTCPFEALGTITGTTPHMYPTPALTKSGPP